MPHLRDPRINLGPRQLAALARFGALRHLDLQLLGVDQVIAGDAKAGRGDLLDRTVLRVAVIVEAIAGRILASFAGVAFAADAVHGDGQCFVRFLADRAIRHRTRFEPTCTMASTFSTSSIGIGFPGELEIKQPRNVHNLLVCVLTNSRILLENLVTSRAAGKLQLVHRLRIE